METWCDGSHDWQAARKGYQIFRKHKAGRERRAVALYTREQLECVELYLMMDDEPAKRLGGLTSMGDIRETQKVPEKHQ